MLILRAMSVLFPRPGMALCRIRTNPQRQHLSSVIRTILPSWTSYALVATFIFLLSSCSKEEHNTPHPDQGVIAVTVNHPQGAEEDDYTVEVDGQPLDEGDNASEPLAPGEHTVLVHNTPGGFTVTDGIACVERVDGTRAITDLINPLPETLYSGTKTVPVVADDTLHLDLSVAKRTRDLRLELTVTEGDPERITAITGTLSGVAGAYDPPAWRGPTTCAVKRSMARLSAPPPCSPETATRCRQTCACSARGATGRR